MNARTYTLAILFLTSLATIVAHYLVGHSIRPILINSDALYLPTLFSDLLSKNGSIKDWFLTPAPYFFPDYPIFLISYLLAPETYSRIAVYSILQPVLTFASIWLLARQLLQSNAFFAAATISISLIWLALTSGEPFALMLVSAHHYGIFLTSIVFVALWLRATDPQTKHSKTVDYWLLGIIAFLATLSDKLFIAQLIVPIATTAILPVMMGRRSFREIRLPILMALIFGAMGSASYKLVVIHPLRQRTSLGVEKLSSNVSNIYETFLSTTLNNPILGALFLIYAGIVIHSIFQLARKGPCNSKIPWLAAFSFISLLSTTAAASLVTDLAVASRYLIASFSWPVIIVFVFISSALERRFFSIATTTSLLATVLLSFSSYNLAKTNGINKNYYPDEISCIDDALEEANVFNGIAQYWDAKHIQNFSRLNLNIAQHFDNLSEMPWITSQHYFKERYDFAIVSEDAQPQFKLSAEMLARLNGLPETVKRCGTKTVILYGQDKLRVKKFENTGDSFTWKACELPSGIGEPTAECEMQKKDAEMSGYLTYGPGESIPSGRYVFEIGYISTASKTDTAGTWDVALARSKKVDILRNGLLAGTDGKIEEAVGEFNIDPQQHMKKIEIRTLANQKMDLKVVYIRVMRMQ